MGAVLSPSRVVREDVVVLDAGAWFSHQLSKTRFYVDFRDVMHVSPLQYAKSVKLHKTQTLIQEGKRANEAGYLVRYNSPAQFSREYKRHFGYSPSAAF
jgi:AraC-like DNA-binding protein